MKYVYGTIPALIVLAGFWLFSNWIPQGPWEPPQKLDITADMTPAQLAVTGEILVRERGCLLCHTIEPGVGVEGRGRAPNFFSIGARSRTTVDYLVESLYTPGSYIVEGYTDIMPVVVGPPTKLEYEEVVAVIDYLLSLGGTPTVRVGDIPRPSGAEVEEQEPPQPLAGDPVSIMQGLGCLACHAIEGEGGSLGPALDRTGVEEDSSAQGLSLEDYIRESILNPEAFVVKDFPGNIMPQDFGERMTAMGMESLVKYLAGLTRR